MSTISTRGRKAQKTVQKNLVIPAYLAAKLERAARQNNVTQAEVLSHVLRTAL